MSQKVRSATSTMTVSTLGPGIGDALESGGAGRVQFARQTNEEYGWPHNQPDREFLRREASVMHVCHGSSPS